MTARRGGVKGEKSKHGTQQMREEEQATQGGGEGRCEERCEV